MRYDRRRRGLPAGALAPLEPVALASAVPAIGGPLHGRHLETLAHRPEGPRLVVLAQEEGWLDLVPAYGHYVLELPAARARYRWIDASREGT